MLSGTLTCQEYIHGPAGEGSEGTGTHTAVAPLHVLGGLAILGGRQQEEGSIPQILQIVVAPLHREGPAILKPGDIERRVAGPQIAVQQEGRTWFQHYMARPGSTAELHRNRLFCVGQRKRSLLTVHCTND